MYDFIINEIKTKICDKEKKYIPNVILNYAYLQLLYLKYLSKGKKTDYSNKDELCSLIPEEKKKLFKQLFEYNIQELIVHFLVSNLDELLHEYIEKNKVETFEEIESIFLNPKDETIYLVNDNKYSRRLLTNNFDIPVYIKMHEILDEMLGKERKIVNSLDNINFNNINTMIIFDNEPAYRFVSTNNIIDTIIQIFFNVKDFKGKIILKTAYSKISIIKKSYLIDNFLSKVILYENSSKDDAILVFDNINQKEDVSIIMIKNEIENDFNKIKEIIDNDIDNKENLIKVSKHTIKSNNYRIGFKMYLPNKTEEVKSINDIIDENTQITEHITYLNKKIQQEMDKLIAK